MWLEHPVLESVLTPGGTPTSRSQAASSCLLARTAGTWRITAGSPHARVCARWIHARPCPCPLNPCTPCLCPCPLDPSMLCPCPLDPHTPVFVPDGSTHIVSMPAGSPHTRAHAHWVPACRACARTRWVPTHPCPCPMDPRTHAHTHRVPTHAPGPHTRSLAGSPRALACGVSIHARTGPMHTCSHWVPALTCSQGPHARIYVSAGCIMCASLSCMY